MSQRKRQEMNQTATGMILFVLFLIVINTGCFSDPTPISGFDAMNVDGDEIIMISGSSSINNDEIVKIMRNCQGSKALETLKKLGVPKSIANLAIDYIEMRKVTFFIYGEGDEDEAYATLVVDQEICSYGRLGDLDKSAQAKIEADLGE